MVARLQKTLVLATLLAMALWWHWAAPRSLGWALAGVALPLLLHAGVLGLQFVLMQRANARAASASNHGRPSIPSASSLHRRGGNGPRGDPQRGAGCAAPSG